jgi:hypothetical protein
MFNWALEASALCDTEPGNGFRSTECLLADAETDVQVWDVKLEEHMTTTWRVVIMLTVWLLLFL